MRKSFFILILCFIASMVNESIAQTASSRKTQRPPVSKRKFCSEAVEKKMVDEGIISK